MPYIVGKKQSAKKGYIVNRGTLKKMVDCEEETIC